MDPIERTSGGRQRPIVIALLALGALAAMAGGVSAHSSEDHGTLTVHDSEDGPPTDGVKCEFWVEGHGLSHPNATIRINHGWGPDRHSMNLAEVQGEENENGTYDFEAGPYEWHAETEQWFEANLAGNHSTPRHEVQYTHCDDFQKPLPGDDPHACRAPRTVEAHSENGTVVVEWRNEPFDDEYEYTHIVRRAPEGTRDFRDVARPPPNATSYVDENVTVGEGYHYYVTQLNKGPRHFGYPCDHATVQVQEDGGETTPACPEDLEAHAQQNEDVWLGWNASANASTYHVYRATEDGAFQHVAQVSGTAYTDNTTEAETTYTYEVTAANEAGEAEDCPTAEVTAIPFFGHPALVAMAAIGSVGAVGVARVRRG